MIASELTELAPRVEAGSWGLRFHETILAQIAGEGRVRLRDAVTNRTWWQRSPFGVEWEAFQTDPKYGEYTEVFSSREEAEQVATNLRALAAQQQDRPIEGESSNG